MKHFVICENDCLVEGMTKEETLALVQSATGYIPTGEEEAIISRIINQNSGGGVKIWFGTRAEYNALAEHDANTIYHITDDKTGNEAYNKAVEVENLFKTYDSDFDGIVDNAEKLGGQLPAYYAKAADLSKYFPNVGGTLTGSTIGLGAGKGSVSGYTDLSAFVHYTDSNNFTQLGVSNKEALNRSVRVTRKVNGENDGPYYLYGTHNKPTLSDIGAMAASGGTADEPQMQWTLSDGSIVTVRKMGSSTAYSVGFVVTKPDGTSGYYSLFDSSTTDTVVRLLTTKGGQMVGDLKAYETERNYRSVYNEETRLEADNHKGALQSVKYFINEIAE